MYRYGQYCPVARAAEIVADRWTVLIIRELLADVTHFNELERGLPHMSRSLLAERLRRLQRVGIVERRAPKRGKWSEYRLTAAGRELQGLIDVLGEWGARWAFGDPRPDELDPIVLLWWMRRRVDFDRIPRRRVVLQFEFRGVVEHTYWLLIEPTDASVCLKNAGFERPDSLGRHLGFLSGLARSLDADRGSAQGAGPAGRDARRRSLFPALVFVEPDGRDDPCCECRPAHCIWEAREKHPGTEAAIP